MSIQRVREYLAQFEMADKILEFDVSSATVLLAAAALGCEPARIAKSLAFAVAEGSILVVTAGDVKVDNQKFKARFSQKAKMLTPDETPENVGYPVGGVCPFGVNADVTVYLDVSLKRFETVFPACGSANSAIELTISQLEKYSGYADWVDVCKLRPME